MEEVEAEVAQGAGDRIAVDQQVALGQMPAARADEQRGDLVVEPILPAVGRLELDRARDRVGEVHVAADHVRPGRRVGVLEVRHEAPGAGVERVDHHLSLRRPGDLDATVLEVGGRRGDAPVAVAHLARFVEEVQGFAGDKARAALGAAAQEVLAGGLEALVQLADEGERIVAEDLVEALVQRGADLDAQVSRPPSIDVNSSSIG